MWIFRWESRVNKHQNELFFVFLYVPKKQRNFFVCALHFIPLSSALWSEISIRLERESCAKSSAGLCKRRIFLWFFSIHAMMRKCKIFPPVNSLRWYARARDREKKSERDFFGGEFHPFLNVAHFCWCIATLLACPVLSCAARCNVHEILVQNQSRRRSGFRPKIMYKNI